MLALELDGEVVTLGASKSAILSLDVVTHEESAKVRPHFIEF